MKYQLCLLLVFLFNSLSYGQNWSPCRTDAVLNYWTDQDEVLRTSIWVYSVSVDGLDTIYHLNRVVQECDTCSVFGNQFLYNQGQFLGKTMTKVGEKYHLNLETTKVLFPQAPLAATWLYDTLQNVMAEVVEVKEELLFDQVDSIKTIALSNQDTLRLSKSWGLMVFPEEGAFPKYQLRGIDNWNLGQTIPKFKDMFDFAIGDVFQYQYYSSNGSNGGMSEKREKRTITGKTISGDTIWYEMDVIGHEIFSLSSTEGPFESNFEYSTTKVYIDSAQHLANAYHSELVSPDFDFGFPNPPIWIFGEFYSDADGRFSKRIGKNWDSTFEIQPGSDLLLQSEVGNFERVFRVGLGETDHRIRVFEGGFSKQLMGYVKGQDTVGVVTSDTGLLLSNHSLTTDLAIKVFPNPAKEQLNIQLYNGSSYELTIYSNMGIPLMREQINDEMTAIDLTGLTNGMYWLKLENDNRSLIERVLIQH